MDVHVGLGAGDLSAQWSVSGQPARQLARRQGLADRVSEAAEPWAGGGRGGRRQAVMTADLPAPVVSRQDRREERG